MSSSGSAYDPGEDEDPPDSDIAIREPRSGFGTSSPPLQNLTLASTPELASSVPGPSRPQSQGSASEKRRSRSRANVWRSYKKLPIDRYREIFDELVKDVVNGSSYGDIHATHPSQTGIVTWTAKEKDDFFDALARKGRNSIPQIASLVGTKTEIEVQAYLDLLQRGFQQQQQEERTKSIALTDIPAAIEIGGKCFDILDDTARALSLQDEQAHNTSGKRKHGDLWLIDMDTAEMVEEQFDSGEIEEQNDPAMFATARLLNISNWIYLSERLFMNPGRDRIDDNWKNIAFEGETPSMTCDAFTDFYSLTVSITRRLVQSSLFFAMSRIRALARPGAQHGNLVRKQDVAAALDVLKMDHTLQPFWVGLPRRCSLDVQDIRHRKGWKTIPLTYDEAEKELSMTPEEASDSRATSIAPMSEPEPFESSESDGYSSDSEQSIQNIRQTHTSDNDLSDPDEFNASLVDRESSRAEELRLWGRLEVPPPEAPVTSENAVKMESDEEGPHRSRKPTQEAVNWQGRVLYRSEWEEYGDGTGALEEELAGNARKRRRVE